MGSAAEHRRPAERASGRPGSGGQGRARAPTETRQWQRLVATRAPGTLQAGGSAISPAEGRSRRRSRSRRRGQRRPGPEGDRVGQRRIASAHCCPARSGAAPTRARSVPGSPFCAQCGGAGSRLSPTACPQLYSGELIMERSSVSGPEYLKKVITLCASRMVTAGTREGCEAKESLKNEVAASEPEEKGWAQEARVTFPGSHSMYMAKRELIARSCSSRTRACNQIT
ncbi:uncharacterized protein [Equus przewalskii]|uniref:Uncharacterized protein n=1 Tax=Equus przewalskii TaxID=9798 RepID=A0ABM4P2L4_EQUPR